MSFWGQNRGRFFEESKSKGARVSRRLHRRAGSILAVALCCLLATACDRGDHPGRIGSPAPEFTVTDGSQTVTLSKLRGHVVILNFWASWCAPCIEEMPSLLALHQKLPQLVIVAISRDEDQDQYRQFLLHFNVDFTTLRDPSMRIEKLYGTAAIPESYVIDRKGILRRKFVSAQDWTNPEILGYLSKL